MESIRVRWIRCTPSERLSSPSYGFMTFFQVSYEQKLHIYDGTLTLDVLFTSGKRMISDVVVSNREWWKKYISLFDGYCAK